MPSMIEYAIPHEDNNIGTIWKWIGFAILGICIATAIGMIIEAIPKIRHRKDQLKQIKEQQNMFQFDQSKGYPVWIHWKLYTNETHIPTRNDKSQELGARHHELQMFIHGHMYTIQLSGGIEPYPVIVAETTLISTWPRRPRVTSCTVGWTFKEHDEIVQALNKTNEQWQQVLMFMDVKPLFLSLLKGVVEEKDRNGAGWNLMLLAVNRDHVRSNDGSGVHGLDSLEIPDRIEVLLACGHYGIHLHRVEQYKGMNMSELTRKLMDRRASYV